MQELISRAHAIVRTVEWLLGPHHQFARLRQVQRIQRGQPAERRHAFADAHRMLYQRISIFVDLPFEGLDKLALQKRLDDIGRTETASSKQDA